MQYVALAGLLSRKRTLPVKKNIEGVSGIPPQSVAYNTPYSGLPLPSMVTVLLDDATMRPLNITWSPVGYDPTSPGAQVLSGVLQLQSDIKNDNNLGTSITITVQSQTTTLYDYYVSPSGNDSTGNGTEGNPFATPHRAVIQYNNTAAGTLKTMKVAAGTYTFTSVLNVPPTLSIKGDGFNNTFFTGNSSLGYIYTNYNWSFDKFLIQLKSGPTGSVGVGSNGNQELSDFTVDGSSRSMHGGIYPGNRHFVTLRNVRIRNFNFCGLWNVGSNSLKLIGCELLDNSRTASDFSSGSLMMSSCNNMEVDNCIINEGRGYGIKAFGPPPFDPVINNFVMHDSIVTVIPTSSYGGGSVANIAVEFHDSWLANNKIYGCNIDNTISLVTVQEQDHLYQNSAKTFECYNNVNDIMTRANGQGYPYEVALHNVHLHHNYMWGGHHAAIVSWNASDNGRPAKQNWDIHNNVIFDQQTTYPSVIVRSRYTGLIGLKLRNNTIQIVRNSPVYIIQLENGNDGSNWDISNNLILDDSTDVIEDTPSSLGGANQFINLSNGSTLSNVTVRKNFITGMPIGSIGGVTYIDNITTGNSGINKTGIRPDPYYRPASGSILIQNGFDNGLPFTGSAPTIGAYEAISNPVVNVVSIVPQVDVNATVGTAFTSLPLPTAVTANLSDGRQVSYNVQWSSVGYNPNAATTYTITGTITTTGGVQANGVNASIRVILSVASSTATYYVSPNGSDINNNGRSASTPFATPQRAADIALAGSVIVVLYILPA